MREAGPVGVVAVGVLGPAGGGPLENGPNGGGLLNGVDGGADAYFDAMRPLAAGALGGGGAAGVGSVSGGLEFPLREGPEVAGAVGVGFGKVFPVVGPELAGPVGVGFGKVPPIADPGRVGPEGVPLGPVGALGRVPPREDPGRVGPVGGFPPREDPGRAGPAGGAPSDDPGRGGGIDFAIAPPRDDPGRAGISFRRTSSEDVGLGGPPLCPPRIVLGAILPLGPEGGCNDGAVPFGPAGISSGQDGGSGEDGLLPAILELGVR